MARLLILCLALAAVATAATNDTTTTTTTTTPATTTPTNSTATTASTSASASTPPPTTTTTTPTTTTTTATATHSSASSVGSGTSASMSTTSSSGNNTAPTPTTTPTTTHTSTHTSVSSGGSVTSASESMTTSAMGTTSPMPPPPPPPAAPPAPPPPSGNTPIFFTNANTGIGLVDVEINPLPGVMWTAVAYGVVTESRTVAQGTYTLSIFKSGTTQKVYTTTITPDVNQTFALLFVGSAADPDILIRYGKWETSYGTNHMGVTVCNLVSLNKSESLCWNQADSGVSGCLTKLGQRESDSYKDSLPLKFDTCITTDSSDICSGSEIESTTLTITPYPDGAGILFAMGGADGKPLELVYALTYLGEGTIMASDFVTVLGTAPTTINSPAVETSTQSAKSGGHHKHKNKLSQGDIIAIVIACVLAAGCGVNSIYRTKLRRAYYEKIKEEEERDAARSEDV